MPAGDYAQRARAFMWRLFKYGTEVSGPAAAAAAAGLEFQLFVVIGENGS